MTGRKSKHDLRTSTFILFQKANYVNFFAKKRSSKFLEGWRSACVNATKIIEILDSLKPPPAPAPQKASPSSQEGATHGDVDFEPRFY
ncbi:MAG: hypothetical protein ACUVV5_09520 [Candidatus Aminicenantales bacterium]